MEQMIHQLAKRQVAAGDQVTVLGRGDGIHDGVSYRRLSVLGGRKAPVFALLGPYRDVLDEAEVVHLHGVDGLLFQLSARPRRYRLAISTHGGFWHQDRWQRTKRWLQDGVVRPALDRFDQVWFTSAVDQDKMGGAGAVCHNGVVGLKGEVKPVAYRLLVVGRGAPHKGHQRCVRQFASLFRQDSRFRLRFVGPSTWAHRRQLAKLATELGVRQGVHFVGEVDRTQYESELLSAEAVLFFSEFESFGLGLAEAMSAGVNVFASDIDAHRGLLGDCPGRLLRSTELLSIPRLRASVPRQAMKDAVAPFLWPAAFERWQRAYQQLVA